MWRRVVQGTRGRRIPWDELDTCWRECFQSDQRPSVKDELQISNFSWVFIAQPVDRRCPSEYLTSHLNQFSRCFPALVSIFNKEKR